MITTADMERLCAEFIATPHPLEPETWMERNEIATDALVHVVLSALRSLRNGIAKGAYDFDGGLPALLASLFQLGWEAHRQYGGVQ